MCDRDKSYGNQHEGDSNGKTALIVIDIQNDYFPKGKMELHQADQALKQINLIEALFLETKQPIIYIQHIFDQSNAPFFGALVTLSCIQV